MAGVCSKAGVLGEKAGCKDDGLGVRWRGCRGRKHLASCGGPAPTGIARTPTSDHSETHPTLQLRA